MSALPIVRAAAWILDQIALDHQMSRIVFGEHGAVGSAARDAPYPRTAQAPPSGDVVVLDHHILNTFLDEHAVDSRAFQLETSQNHVVGFHHHVVIGEVEDVADVLGSSGWS